MKILEEGTKGLNWTIEHRCTGWGNGGNGCNALLEVEKSDLKYYPGNDSVTWGGRDPAVTFQCPCCDSLTDLGLNDWPAGYRELPRYTSTDSWYEHNTVDKPVKVA